MDSGTFWFSPTPESISSAWGATLNRICSWVVLRDKGQGRKLKIYNAHLDHESELSRQNSILMLQERLKEDGRRGIYAIVLGDFNKTFSGEQLHSSLFPGWSEAGLLAERVLTDQGTYHDFGRKLGAAPRIDYVFVPDGSRVERYEVVTVQMRGGLFPSDHFPVRVRLFW
ncbi:endonuclease/exonuclease/phosphatase family protein [Bergeyella sp. RCAD1439]|uniref:endonuclease/exonuclease/phosphatase family protein n=1 Tax=Bergeyella anatis TaxID=3113737 RepID=UPI002E17CB5F|nr:endonuclease/exonuclease/phosphatase family protein [Bergeyella sp. RCAD1439]